MLYFFRFYDIYIEIFYKNQKRNMTREYFMRIFIDVSNKIISLEIDIGYFDSSD